MLSEAKANGSAAPPTLAVAARSSALRRLRIVGLSDLGMKFLSVSDAGWCGALSQRGC